MNSRGPKPKILTEDEVSFLQLYLKTRGIVWCARRLDMARQTLSARLRRYQEKYGEIEFVEPRPIRKETRLQHRPFWGPTPRKSSCCRWPGISDGHNKHNPAIPGRRIA